MGTATTAAELLGSAAVEPREKREDTGAEDLIARLRGGSRKRRNASADARRLYYDVYGHSLDGSLVMGGRDKKVCVPQA